MCSGLLLLAVVCCGCWLRPFVAVVCRGCVQRLIVAAVVAAVEGGGCLLRMFADGDVCMLPLCVAVYIATKSCCSMLCDDVSCCLLLLVVVWCLTMVVGIVCCSTCFCCLQVVVRIVWSC